MKEKQTTLERLISKIEEINNSIFALSSSELELKMLIDFRTMLVNELDNERQELLDQYIEGYNDGEHGYLRGF